MRSKNVVEANTIIKLQASHHEIYISANPYHLLRRNGGILVLSNSKSLGSKDGHAGIIFDLTGVGTNRFLFVTSENAAFDVEDNSSLSL
jgi:hypothetical protein